MTDSEAAQGATAAITDQSADLPEASGPALSSEAAAAALSSSAAAEVEVQPLQLVTVTAVVNHLRSPPLRR